MLIVGVDTGGGVLTAVVWSPGAGTSSSSSPDPPMNRAMSPAISATATTAAAARAAGRVRYHGFGAGLKVRAVTGGPTGTRGRGWRSSYQSSAGGASGTSWTCGTSWVSGASGAATGIGSVIGSWSTGAGSSGSQPQRASRSAAMPEMLLASPASTGASAQPWTIFGAQNVRERARGGCSRRPQDQPVRIMSCARTAADITLLPGCIRPKCMSSVTRSAPDRHGMLACRLR